MICPECGSETLTKDGVKTTFKRVKKNGGVEIVEVKRQRYFCHNCKIHTTRVDGAAPVGSEGPIKCVCNRCGHEWYSKGPELPKACAKCKTHYWNQPRKLKRRVKAV